jgi:hypothetical protein
VGYYINPNFTPISEINFSSLKSAGVTDVYVLVTNDNYLSVLSQVKTKADAVGIKTNAWVYPGFIYPSPVAHMELGSCWTWKLIICLHIFHKFKP